MLNTTNLKMEPWIQTYKGFRFNALDLQSSDIHIEDIAHALSRTCRWGGHCRDFYSVAQHSVAVMLKVPSEYHLVALMHDASEAYIGDMPSPIKQLLPDYQLLEDMIMDKIADKFNFAYPLPSIVKQMDAWMGNYEAHNLLEDTSIVESWAGPNPLPEYPLICWGPDYAKNMFMYHYNRLLYKNEVAI